MTTVRWREETETVRYDYYEIRRHIPSKYATTDNGFPVMIEVSVGVKCPRCHTENSNIEHGEKCICSNCKLTMTRFGNALQMTDD